MPLVTSQRAPGLLIGRSAKWRSEKVVGSIPTTPRDYDSHCGNAKTQSPSVSDWLRLRLVQGIKPIRDRQRRVGKRGGGVSVGFIKNNNTCTLDFCVWAWLLSRCSGSSHCPDWRVTPPPLRKSVGIGSALCDDKTGKLFILVLTFEP